LNGHRVPVGDHVGAGSVTEDEGKHYDQGGPKYTAGYCFHFFSPCFEIVAGRGL
jgi:hypothetical protein